MVRGGDNVRLLPSQPIVVGDVSEATLFDHVRTTVVSSHYDSLAIADKYRRFDHDGRLLRDAGDGASCFDAIGSADAVHPLSLMDITRRYSPLRGLCTSA